MIKFTKSYKAQVIVESQDHPYPDETWHIKEKIILHIVKKYQFQLLRFRSVTIRQIISAQEMFFFITFNILKRFNSEKAIL